MASRPLVSILIPLYNESLSLCEFQKLLFRTLRILRNQFQFEILWIDDGSVDETWHLLQKIAREEGIHNRLFRFSRNFGHQAALTAGFEQAHGEFIITLDGDGQHPPSLISKLLAIALRGNYDIVHTRRMATTQVSFWKLMTSNGFYRLFSFFSGVPLVPGFADFRLIRSRVLRELNSYPEKDRFYRALFFSLGFSWTVLPYIAPKRLAGESKMTLKKMTAFALQGITAFSVAPLRIASLMGIITAVIGFFYLGVVVMQKILYPQTVVAGWSTVIVLVLFLSGVQMGMIGIIGEYVAAVFREIKSRPSYILQEKRE